MKICAICGREAECTHHLIFGSNRHLADKDHLTIDLCNRCHNTGAIAERVHDNSSAEALSKMVGQYKWMLDQITSDDQQDLLIDRFRRRYGRSYI